MPPSRFPPSPTFGDSSPNYIQHSAHIPPGREGLFALIKGSPEASHCENGLPVANGNPALLHGRFSGLCRPANCIVLDIVLFDTSLLPAHRHAFHHEPASDPPSGHPH